MRTHRKYVQEPDEEERRVRPAGCRGDPERRQHERCVVHHRYLRDIHRREVYSRRQPLPLVPGRGTHSVRATATALSVCFSFSRRAEAEHRANVMHEWPRCLRRGRGAESAGRGGREARSRAHRGEEAADGERKGGRMDAGADVGVGQGPRWCPACPLWLSRTVSRADRTPSSGRDVGIIITHRTLRWFVRFGHGRRSDDEKY
jgi:hypothetical protein